MSFQPSAAVAKSQCTLVDVFASDPRPTLVVDLSYPPTSNGVKLDFANDAFTRHYSVLMRFIISGQTLEPHFIEWLNANEPKTATYTLGELSWSCFIFDGRWKIISVLATTHATERNSTPLAPPNAILPSPRGAKNDVPAVSTKLPPAEQTRNSREKADNNFTVALPSRLVSAPLALEGLHRSVEMADVGFFEYALDGVLIFANKSWYALSGHPHSPEEHTKMKFMDLCHPDDCATVSGAWATLMSGNPITFEMRWKNTNSSSSRLLGAQWVLAACIPTYDEDQNIKSISGCTTDINNQKLSAQIANSQAEAREKAQTFERRFVRFASVAPNAMFILDAIKRV